MEEKLHIDTHVFVWLYAGETGRFPERAVQELEKRELAISPMCLLEADYLFEIGKTSVRGKQIFKELNAKVDLQLAEGSFTDVIESASSLSWTRDPFDRLIVAHASLTNAHLLTKDVLMKRHYRRCIWS